MNKLLIICFYLIAYHRAFAQKSDTLHTVDILGAKSELTEKSQIVDKINLQSTVNNSLVNAIEQFSPVAIISGGLNDFAGISIRGASMSQTRVVWNDVPINSVLSGMLDFQSLKSKMFSSANIVTDADGALYGNQCVGGIILLKNSETDSTNGFYVDLGAASFHNFSSTQVIHASKKKWNLEVSNNFFSGKNNYNFPFKDNQFWLYPTNRNALMKGNSTMFHMSYHTTHWQSKLHIWYQDKQRQISPLDNQFDNEASIREKFIRLSWQNSFNYNKVSAKYVLGYSKENLDYTNPYYSIFAKNNFFQISNILRWQFTDSKLFKKVYFEFNNQLAVAQINHSNSPVWNYNSLGVNRKWTWSHGWSTYVGLSEVIFRANWITLPSFQFSKSWKTLSSFINVSKVFRVPTVNELYYFPGGNDSLKPEYGWNTSLNFKYHNIDNTTNLSLSIFYRHIQNWVIWYGSLIWSPHNLATVQSQGMEWGFDRKFDISENRKLLLNINGNFLHTILKKSNNTNFDNSEGRDLPYIPQSMINLNLSYSHSSWNLTTNIHRVGKRYASLDNSWILDPYITIDAFLEKSFWPTQSGYKCKLRGGIHNISNTYYEIILNKPMPGRYYEATLIWNWK